MVIKIRVQSDNPNEPHLVEIGEKKECLNTMTVFQLKEKLLKIASIRSAVYETSLTCNGVIMENGNKSLAHYGLSENSLVEFQKYFDREKHFGIKFVHKADAITGDASRDMLRAELSCGHAVDPNSLTAWCRSLIDSGKYELHCPAILNDSTLKKCGKTWSYVEIRKIALLNASEMSTFEKKLSENAAGSFIDFKECPKCRSFVEKTDSSIIATCMLCQILHKKAFKFCWQCENEWNSVKGPISNESCGRPGCVHKSLEVLAQCKFIKLKSCAEDMPKIPSIRACPTCGKLIEHIGDKCKNIICTRCNVEFCFACLQKTVDCLKDSSHYNKCNRPIAPIQKHIPIWQDSKLNE